MSHLLPRTWTSNALGGTRRQRATCHYNAYSPDPLSGREFQLDGDMAADVADAEIAITRLNENAAALVNTEALARILMRAEAVASSRIEGLRIGARRLLRAEVSEREGARPIDVTASEILRNIAAMDYGLANLSVGDNISLDLLLETHRRLLAGSIIREHGGRLRNSQNWIGGNEFNPCGATYVPPPPEFVTPLMRDLLEFCNDDSLPAVAQAAIAHAQFETIHPFVDGNGRIGRVLIHQILRRRGLAVRVLAPVSLVLAARAEAYVQSLTLFRYVGDVDSKEAHEGVNLLMGSFAAACSLAVAEATHFESIAQDIEGQWRSAVGNVRSNSTTDRLLKVLSGASVVTTNGVAEILGCSWNAANTAVNNLVTAKVLQQVTLGKRNRAFEAPRMIEAFTNLEMDLTTPSGLSGQESSQLNSEAD